MQKLSICPDSHNSIKAAGPLCRGAPSLHRCALFLTKVLGSREGPASGPAQLGAAPPARGQPSSPSVFRRDSRQPRRSEEGRPRCRARPPHLGTGALQGHALAPRQPRGRGFKQHPGLPVHCSRSWASSAPLLCLRHRLGVSSGPQGPRKTGPPALTMGPKPGSGWALPSSTKDQPAESPECRGPCD